MLLDIRNILWMAISLYISFSSLSFSTWKKIAKRLFSVYQIFTIVLLHMLNRNKILKRILIFCMRNSKMNQCHETNENVS